MNVRKNVGGGSFLAGYKRAFADSSSLELHGAVGMRTLLSAQHSVQLSPESSASLIASWQPNAGPGLQVRRHITAACAANTVPAACPAGCAAPLPLPFRSLASHAATPAVPARPACLQFVNTRQLLPTVSGEYGWVVGPEEAAGMSLGLTRRTEKLMLMGRLEVGAYLPCLPARCPFV